ncbi:DUF6332 family protein [Streptomyces xiamenensis]
MAARSEAERDALTVELVFALLTGALRAATVFAVVWVPVEVLEAPGRDAWLTAAGTLAGVAFTVRVVRVLWRWEPPAGPPERTHRR